MTNYHNTTAQEGQTLTEFTDKATSQDDKVLAWFRKQKSGSPSDVWINLFLNTAPITSVRRSINSLTNMGFLKKTDGQKEGHYGRPEHIWKLRTETN